MRYTLTVLILILGLSVLGAQEKQTRYLFPEFTDSYIYYKDGRVFQVPTNYDLFENKFVFIDKDNEKKEFSDPNMIVSVKADNRTFIPISGNEAAEVMQTEPRILVQYIGNKRIKKDLTFGGKTGEYDKNTVLINIDYQFYVEKDKRLKQFSTKKQFLKLFSKQKKELKKYIDENNVDFGSIDQVVKLCNHAFSKEEK